MKKYWPLVIVLAGIADAGYLTYEHFADTIPPCTNAILTLVDCGKVLKSSYAMLVGVPVAVWGLGHYAVLGTLVYLGLNGKRWAKYLAVGQTGIGMVFSAYLVYIQLWLIKSICWYCMGSAIISLGLFLVVWSKFGFERKKLSQKVFEWVYVYGLRRLLFLVDSERVHNWLTGIGEKMGRVNNWLEPVLVASDPRLKQQIAGINFGNPVGLAAGFDYEARLTGSLAGWGWGFQTVGTITNGAYEGNDKPRLGRLPKSKSLLVNKGFKNLGATAIVTKLAGKKFRLPVGISIGKTNTLELTTQKASVADICTAFEVFEDSKVEHNYYELNISCPNLQGDVEFYEPKHLAELLTAVDKLKLSRPVFIKMPIDKSEDEFKELVKVISKHKITGIIIGNLQKNREHPSLDREEVAKYARGYFSGKPTQADSDRLIKLAYRTAGKSLVIIGCGGIFSAEDAWRKIVNGASLVQLITGMIYQGPQLTSQVAAGLVDRLEQAGYKNIAEAVGKAA